MEKCFYFLLFLGTGSAPSRNSFHLKHTKNRLKLYELDDVEHTFINLLVLPHIGSIHVFSDERSIFIDFFSKLCFSNYLKCIWKACRICIRWTSTFYLKFATKKERRKRGEFLLHINSKSWQVSKGKSDKCKLMKKKTQLDEWMTKSEYSDDVPLERVCCIATFTINKPNPKKA